MSSFSNKSEVRDRIQGIHAAEDQAQPGIKCSRGSNTAGDQMQLRINGRRRSEIGGRSLEVGTWKSEFGGRSLEVGVWRLELGGWRSEDGGRRSNFKRKSQVETNGDRRRKLNLKDNDEAIRY